MIREEFQRDIDILHAAKQKEVLLNGVRVDGFHTKNNTAFEFHGCLFHGCIDN